jgi:hypothetical protein
VDAVDETFEAVREDIRAVASSLQPADREYIRNLSESELIRLHRFTLGLYLRNAFRKGQYRFLFRHCDEQETPETRSFDSISVRAIRLVWEYLRATPEAEPGAAPDPVT